MNLSQKHIAIGVRDNEHCKRLADPLSQNIFHMEALLPFSEAIKLDRGNANVRPPKEKKPLTEMMATIDDRPETFHLKNRGITYLCNRFQFDNAKRELTLWIPNLPKEMYEDVDAPKFGIADGGHTFEAISRTIAKLADYEAREDWNEPYVRVHFLSGDTTAFEEVEQIVEALNTSLQVQQYTLDEYQHKFEELKEALANQGFDVNLIAFRENEEKEWHVIEIIQRMACFLKDRWEVTQPASMYKSKGKALDLYTSDSTRGEFRRLYDVIRDVITLPEFIQSEFSEGGVIEGRRFGKLRAVKPLKKLYARPGTEFQTRHKMDMAALLPMAAAFRELLALRGDRYLWKVNPHDVFRRSADRLYNILANRISKVKQLSHLGSDMEYWSACVPVVMRAKDDMIESKLIANK